MIIGNDIIDLSYWLPLNKASNPRYIDKICTQEEQAALALAEDANLLLLRLWSMKEAAYKIAVKLGAERAFIPKRLESVIVSAKKGQVKSVWGEFLTLTETTPNFLHTIASNESLDIDRICSQVFSLESSLPEIQSKVVKTALLDKIAAHLELHTTDLNIEMIDNIPRLFVEGQLSGIDLTMSHNGGWGAFCVYT